VRVRNTEPKKYTYMLKLVVIGQECTDVFVKHTVRRGQTNFVMIPVDIIL